MHAEFSYIPEGYEIVSNHKTHLRQEVICKNGNNQIRIRSGNNAGASLGLDTENAQCGEIKLNDYDGFYSITERCYILMWSTGKYNHVITADRCDKIAFEDVVQIAQSAKGIN
ncbi:MAG: DUF4367 domain-containing protein [Clostridia bacterium]|nr:DUF4367 domain-containing protein [Clostridia bacterium]